MKRLLLILLFISMIFTGFRCTKNISDSPTDQVNLKIKEVIAKANTSCESVHPDQSLQWLKDIVMKAEGDKRTKKYLGNYMGKIFLASYHNQPVFFITMMLGSGGLYGYRYDCNGDKVTIPQNDIITFDQNAQKSTLIYSNVPI